MCQERGAKKRFFFRELAVQEKDDRGNLLDCDWINTKYDTRQRSNLVVRSTDQLRFIQTIF